MEQLASHPARRPLLKKSGHAFLGIRRQGVHAHDFFGVGVCFRLIEIDLRVIGLFAERHHQGAGPGDARGATADDVIGNRVYAAWGVGDDGDATHRHQRSA